MRHFLPTVIFSLLTCAAIAQNVGINNASPDSTLSITSKLLIGGSQGDVVFTDDMGSIQFPATSTPNSAMIYMFDGGTANADRHVIAHSPSHPFWGLGYNDDEDAFHFTDHLGSLLMVDLGAVSGLGIGLDSLEEYLHFKARSLNDNLRLEGDYFYVDNYGTNGGPAGYRFYDQGNFAGAMFYEANDDHFNFTHAFSSPGLVVDLSGGNRVGIDTWITPDAQLAVSGNVQILSGFEASLSSDGYLQTGATTSSNLVMDNNEIAARNNGAESPLWLQPNQGNVVIGSSSSWLTSTLHVDSDAGENPLRVQRQGTTEFLVDSNGQVLVSSLTAKPGYELCVNGQMVCEEVLVQNSTDWPDYVFADDYHLPSLAEVEQHILLHRHLPDVPSAAEIEEEGILLAEMEKTILRKVEELTLYMIEQSKEIEELRRENAELRALIQTDKQ